jgi:hypothetical protein
MYPLAPIENPTPYALPVPPKFAFFFQSEHITVIVLSIVLLHTPSEAIKVIVYVPNVLNVYELFVEVENCDPLFNQVYEDAPEEVLVKMTESEGYIV